MTNRLEGYTVSSAYILVFIDFIAVCYYVGFWRELDSSQEDDEEGAEFDYVNLGRLGRCKCRGEGDVHFRDGH